MWVDGSWNIGIGSNFLTKILTNNRYASENGGWGGWARGRYRGGAQESISKVGVK